MLFVCTLFLQFQSSTDFLYREIQALAIRVSILEHYICIPIWWQRYYYNASMIHKSCMYLTYIYIRIHKHYILLEVFVRSKYICHRLTACIQVICFIWGTTSNLVLCQDDILIFIALGMVGKCIQIYFMRCHVTNYKFEGTKSLPIKSFS